MMITANELMTPSPAAVKATDSLFDAVQVLQTLEVRHLPVVNAQHELIGILSDRDLGSLALPVVVNAEWVGTARAMLDAPVSSLMTADPISVDPETDAGEIIALMLDNKIGAVPVVDVEGRLAGIVSYVDVLRLVESASA